jgi:hypothetical protein
LVAFEKTGFSAIGYKEAGEPGSFRPFQTLLAGARIYEKWVKITAEEFEDLWQQCRAAYYDENGDFRNELV